MLYKLARFMNNTGPLRILAPIGISLLIMGIIMLSMTPHEYAETTGTVTAVHPYEDEGKTVYDIDFDYTVDGKTYTGTFSGFSEECAIGQQIRVYYDADEPQFVSNTRLASLFAIIMIVVGAIVLGIGLFLSIGATLYTRSIDRQTAVSDAVKAVARENRNTAE